MSDTDAMTARERAAVALLLRAMRRLERADLAHAASITITLRGRNLSARVDAVMLGGVTVSMHEYEHVE